MVLGQPYSFVLQANIYFDIAVLILVWQDFAVFKFLV